MTKYELNEISRNRIFHSHRLVCTPINSHDFELVQMRVYKSFRFHVIIRVKLLYEFRTKTKLTRFKTADTGTHTTGSAKKLAVVSKELVPELGHLSTRNNFHSEILR